MDKDSINLYAETLLFQIGIRGQGLPGTRKSGLATLSRYLQREGLPPEDYRLEDGCGLSRYDAVSPEEITHLLARVPRDPLVYSPLLVALPIAGTDGTMADRLSALKGRFRAKTGTMSAVSNVAGYLSTSDGRTLAIAIMTNGYLGTPERVRHLQDALVLAIADATGGR